MEDTNARYIEKISIIDGVDPFQLVDLSTDVYDLPKITYGDIVNYLVFERSAYTLEEFKNFKSLESYNFFLCGWIKELGVKTVGNYNVLVGKVLHSQRLNEKPLDVWVIAKGNGEICSAHCTCVAGLGETCSHVGAILFAVENKISHLEERTVTGVKAYWKVPSGQPGQPSTSKGIDYTSSKKMQQLAKKEQQPQPQPQNQPDIPESSPQDVLSALTNLWEKQESSVLHRIVEPFAETLRAEDELRLENKLQIFEESNLKLDLQTLIKMGESVDFSLTAEECQQIEELTRKQSKCSAWFKFRRGRITASNFRACLATKIENPSISLLKQVCYTPLKQFKSPAMLYGCEHEKKALEDFKQYLESSGGKHIHQAEFKEVGFVINPQYPEVGASPDGLIECECCGQATIEIKCPHCAQNMTIDEATMLKNFCLDRHRTLSRNHKFFYQCQMQMAVTERQLCYFVVWTKNDLAVNVIPFDKEFWADSYRKIKMFHKSVIMPELLGKFFTRRKRPLVTDESITLIGTTESEHQPSTSQETLYCVATESEPQPSTSQETLYCVATESEPQPSTSQETLYCVATESEPQHSTSQEKLYCVCRKPEDNRPMIACDNYSNCPIEWYHLDCVGLTSADIPSVWYCRICSE